MRIALPCLTWLLAMALTACGEGQLTSPDAPLQPPPQQAWDDSDIADEKTDEPLPEELTELDAQTLSVPIAPAQCDQIWTLVNQKVDVAAALNACINETPSGGTLELPPGTLWVGNAVDINHPIIVRTAGTDESMPACGRRNGPPCTIIKALPTLNTAENGFFRMNADGVVVDHLIVDGSRKARRNTEAGQSCRRGRNSFGHNIRMAGGDSRLSNTESRNALCGTGLLIYDGTSNPYGKVIEHNRIRRNGTHDTPNMWADGVTVHGGHVGLVFRGNFVSDNTDVDLIVAECTDCVFHHNRITHTRRWSYRSFAALMLHSWGGSGDFTGSRFEHNQIDCGPMKACLFGMQLGSKPWTRNARVYQGGRFHKNLVRRAKVGVNVGVMRKVTFTGNRIERSGGDENAKRCGPRRFPTFVVHPESRVRIRSGSFKGKEGVERLAWESCLPI
ncbi:MAG: hypothetical protein ACE366_24590 [Bradymonadia bacterium]